MQLHYRTYGDSTARSLIILHGLFGLGDNWVRIARNLSTTYYVVVPDHRNHGLSPHSDEFSPELMADDLNELINTLELQHPVLLGHSMGGKVAMHYALRYPEKISGLIVADISTKASYVRPEHKHIVDQFQQLDLERFRTLQEIQAYLSNTMSSQKLGFMVLKNIRREGNQFRWKLNMDGIFPNLEKVMQAIESDESYMNAAYFIRGGQSDYILEEDIAELRSNFPFAEVKTIEGASHWLHADEPEIFLRHVQEYLALIRY